MGATATDEPVRSDRCSRSALSYLRRKSHRKATPRGPCGRLDFAFRSTVRIGARDEFFRAGSSDKCIPRRRGYTSRGNDGVILGRGETHRPQNVYGGFHYKWLISALRRGIFARPRPGFPGLPHGTGFGGPEKHVVAEDQGGSLCQ